MNEKYYTLLILKNIPEDRRFRDKHYFMGAIDDEIFISLEKLSQDSRHAKFFKNITAKNVCCIGQQVHAKNEKDALKISCTRAKGFLDGILISSENINPIFSEISVVQKHDENDGKIILWSEDAECKFWPDGEKEKEELKIKHQQDKLFEHSLPFFDLVSEIHAKHDSELSIQIQRSINLYAEGVKNKNKGIEFICKFAAMESLACGGERKNKKQKLIDRVPLLFPNDSDASKETIIKLWDMRNDALHEAAIVYSEKLNPKNAPELHIDNLDKLVHGLFYFSINNIDTCNSIKELWDTNTPIKTPLPEDLKNKIKQNKLYANQITQKTDFVFRNSKSIFEILLPEN